MNCAPSTETTHHGETSPSIPEPNAHPALTDELCTRNHGESILPMSSRCREILEALNECFEQEPGSHGKD